MCQDKDYIEITNEKLYEMIPLFSQFIEIGRMGYRSDLSSEELAKTIVDWEINKKRKQNFKIVERD